MQMMMTEIIESYNNVIGKKDNYFGYTTMAHISYESLKSDIQYQTSKIGKQALVSVAAKYPDTGSTENLLLIAASLGFAEIIKRTIPRASNLEARDPYGRTMLANASVNGHKGIIELLVRAGVDVNARDINGDTPLILAISRNNIEVVEALLAAKADMEVKNNYGDNAFFRAVSGENIELVQILLEAGANINGRNKYNRTPLMHAIACDYISIAELLIDRCNNLNIADFRGETAIVYAVKYNKLSLIPLMVEKGAEFKSEDINLLKIYLRFNYYGEKNIDLKLVKYLLDLGADPNLHDSFERTPLIYAVEMGNVELTEICNFSIS